VSASASRRSDGSEYPPDILFLADIFGVEPESIMKNPHTYAEQTHGTGDPNSGHIDPCKLLE
jgi:hypothetical protein